MMQSADDLAMALATIDTGDVLLDARAAEQQALATHRAAAQALEQLERARDRGMLITPEQRLTRQDVLATATAALAVAEEARRDAERAVLARAHEAIEPAIREAAAQIDEALAAIQAAFTIFAAVQRDSGLRRLPWPGLNKICAVRTEATQHLRRQIADAVATLDR
jgi:hypothetical protein